MIRAALLVFGVIWVLTGIYIFFMPQRFYDSIPGLDLMGPFSIHFIRDVALVYLASGGVTIYAALKEQRSLAIAGTLWPLLHGLFHIQIWSMRGFPFDDIFFFDLAAVIGSSAIAFGLAWRLGQRAS